MSASKTQKEPVPLRGYIRFGSSSQYWCYSKGLFSKPTLSLGEGGEASIFNFIPLADEEDAFCIRCSEAGEDCYVCWDIADRFEFRAAVGPWERFLIYPLQNEKGEPYYAIRTHKGYLAPSSKSFMVGDDAARCYIEVA